MRVSTFDPRIEWSWVGQNLPEASHDKPETADFVQGRSDMQKDSNISVQQDSKHSMTKYEELEEKFKVD